MEILYYLIPLALFLAGAFVVAFRWAARTDQFEDLDTPAIRILLDDEPVAEKTAEKSTDSSSTSPDTP